MGQSAGNLYRYDILYYAAFILVGFGFLNKLDTSKCGWDPQRLDVWHLIYRIIKMKI